METHLGDRRIGAIDMVGLALSLATLAGLFLLQRQSVTVLAPMFRDFGTSESLPLVTRLTLSNAFPVGVAVFGLVTLAAAFAQRSANVRRVFLLVVICVAGVAAALTILGWYLPIFQLAGAIKAD